MCAWPGHWQNCPGIKRGTFSAESLGVCGVSGNAHQRQVPSPGAPRSPGTVTPRHLTQRIPATIFVHFVLKCSPFQKASGQNEHFLTFNCSCCRARNTSKVEIPCCCGEHFNAKVQSGLSMWVEHECDQHFSCAAVHCRNLCNLCPDKKCCSTHMIEQKLPSADFSHLTNAAIFGMVC